MAIVGLFCSVMIYVDTRRSFWAGPITGIKFFGTAFLLGTAGAATVLGWSQVLTPNATSGTAVTLFAMAATVVRTLLFGWESANLREGLSIHSPIHRSTLTIWLRLRPLLIARVALFLFSTTFGIGALFQQGTAAAIWATIAFALTFISQAIERYFFFTAVDAPKMPGGLAS
jgi:DMSO reductase anchor subunit